MSQSSNPNSNPDSDAGSGDDQPEHPSKIIADASQESTTPTYRDDDEPLTEVDAFAHALSTAHRRLDDDELRSDQAVIPGGVVPDRTQVRSARDATPCAIEYIRAVGVIRTTITALRFRQVRSVSDEEQTALRHLLRTVNGQLLEIEQLYLSESDCPDPMIDRLDATLEDVFVRLDESGVFPE